MAEPKPKPKQIPSTTGARIKVLRQALGLSQDNLATRLGISRSLIAQWETNRLSPHHVHFEHLSKELNVHVTYLQSGSSSILTGDEFTLISEFRACELGDRKLLVEIATTISDKKVNNRRVAKK
jgi:transcriptional regulator with XRE-family HTH domain